MKRVISILMALVLVLSSVYIARPARAYAASEEELAEIQERKEELSKQIDEAKANKNQTLQQKYLMDQRNAVLMEEISAVSQQISETSARIEENKKQEKEQYELFCRQVRQEEERGAVSYWSVLFKATSFTDLLSRVDFINEVTDHDQSVIDTLRNLRKQLASDKESLESDQSELNAAQAELTEQIAAAQKLAEEYSATADGLQEMYDEEARAAEQMEEELRQAELERQRQAEEEERRRQEEAERQAQQNNNDNDDNDDDNGDNGGNGGNGGNSHHSSGSVPDSDGYIWPTNNTRLITSPMGNRASPGGIGSTDHQGVDIGADYGTDILASKAGEVVQSGWYGGYGYCVTIQHGNSGGDYTRYGHMSSILVDEGETVSQGQVIGLVGSTGNSTGPHIHFEIHEDYCLLDPLDYLGGWIPYDW
ncbi:MAG: peptidoglycan DD-metalloendopeptidase family protein [Clostridiales bacterium]|nr:peptidoglycan DD-metalloendopeptidase family protein [Candidatus Cacconaster stercorequi]